MPPKPASGKGHNMITSFFKPATTNTSTPQDPAINVAGGSQPPSSPSLRDPSPLPSSSPSFRSLTPSKKAARDRDVVIAASDEEADDGSSSDDELEDLMAKFDPRKNAEPELPKPPRNACETPRTKRTMIGTFDSSPLTINPKHQFDMKALAKDALKDNATYASSLRNKEAVEQKSRRNASDIAFLDIVQDQGGADAHKVLRAVKRAAPEHFQLRYCFFSLDYEPPASKKVKKGAVQGPWKLLTNSNIQTREQYLVSGLPQTLIRKTGSLPEELFEWLLDELCIEKSILMQQEYRELLSGCSEYVESHITPQRLEELFLRLGARDELNTRHDELELIKQTEEPYKNKDWSCVKAFIEFLGQISTKLPLASLIFCLQTMLRLSMDKFLLCTIDVLTTYEKAVRRLLDALPHSSWDAFCKETSQLLYYNFKPNSIRVNGLLCLPISSQRAHELRRRLAVAFFFDNPALAGHHPDTIVTIRGVIDRLDTDDFTITQDTDFDELRASILLLNITVDDGSFVATGDSEAEKQFNADIDDLATKLREVWRRINDSGMKLARTEAKSVIEWVQQRIAHSVRTRKKAKKSVFDTTGNTEDPFLPQQQNYMRSFLGKSLGKTSGNSTPSLR